MTCGQTALSYAELDARAGRLAAVLRDRGDEIRPVEDHILNADNVFDKLLKQLEPFQNLNTQQADLSRDVTATQRELLRKIELDSQIQAKLLSELSNLNTVLVKATSKNRFQRFMDKLFGGVRPQ